MPPQAEELARQVWELVDLLRPFNALGALLAYCIGYVIAPGTRLGSLLVGLAIVALLHSVATLDNDVQDSAIDRLNKRRGPLLEGRLSRDAARWMVYGLAIVALGLAWRLDVVSFGYALTLLVLIWLYNDPPLYLSRRPVASILLLGLVYGSLPLAFGYHLAGGGFTWMITAMALAWGVIRASLSVLKDFKDKDGDEKTGKRTFFLVYGSKAAVAVSLVGGVLGYAGALTALALSGWPNGVPAWALGLVVLLAARDIWGRLGLARTSDLVRLNEIFHKSLTAHNQFEGGLLLCLVLLGL